MHSSIICASPGFREGNPVGELLCFISFDADLYWHSLHIVPPQFCELLNTCPLKQVLHNTSEAEYKNIQQEVRLKVLIS